MSEYQFSESSTRVSVTRIGEHGDISVTQDHRVESMGPDEGPYEFYYDYDDFRFEQGDTAVMVRSYRDEPNLASFIGMEIGGTDKLLERPDFNLLLIRTAVQHLRTLGKEQFQWLDPASAEGYSPIPPVRVVDV